MKHLPVILLIVFITILPSCKFFREKGLFNKKARTLAILKAEQDSIRVADSVRKVQEKFFALENARLDSIRLADEERLSLASKYNIIVGSFITPEYARAWADVYSKRGYNTNIIRMEGSRFELVSAEAHENLRKAFNRLKQFQDTVEVDAWIYIKK
jgi:hypothetical protein